jgi:hypothetical protein
MRRWMIGMGLVWVAALGAGTAQACMMCGTSLECSWSPAGGRWCISGNAVCVMGGACAGSPRPQSILEDAGAIQMTILEDAPGASPVPARLVANAGAVAVGRHALRIARGSRAGFSDDGAIVFSGRGYAEGGTAVFRSPTGDGFTLARESDGRGARLRVCALAGSQPGRLLASERLGEDDALVVRVPFSGRTCVLVLQAPTLPRDEAVRRDGEASRAIREASFGRPEPTRPPFELSVLDR